MAPTTRWQGGPRSAFLDWKGPADPSVDVGVAEIALPIRYWRTDCFMGLFSADLDAVRDLLPSRRLHPVRVTGNKVVVAVGVFNYLETSVGPYGEIAVSPLCTLDRMAPPVLPLATGYLRGMSGFVAHLPVTSRIAREAGRRVWGYPKFVADMDFDLRPESQRVEMSEDGQEILSLEVRRRGHVALETAPLTTYTAHGDRLVRTTIAMRGHVATAIGPSHGELVLGDHAVGREIAALGIGRRPLVTRTYLSHSAILPAGVDLGPVDRSYGGHQGSDAEFGRHTVRYDEGLVRTVTERTSGLVTAGGDRT
jgi:hypothetical protein